MKGVLILNLMGGSKRRVLIHKNMKAVRQSGHVDIILTPQFYTFLREELAIKFAYQAKQIAPALFDDYLEVGKEYQYHVFKSNSYWYFFAYNIDEIISFLKEKGVEAHQVGKIYFAQELASLLEEPMLLGEEEAMQSMGDIVAIIPKRLINPEDDTYKELDLSKVSLHNGIALSSSYESVIPLKQTVFITTLLVVLGGVFLVEGNRIKGSLENIEAKRDLILAKNPKLGSALIRNSELGKYEPINKKERLKRDSIKVLSKMLSAKSVLKMLSVDDKSVMASIETKDANSAKQIRNRAKTKKFTIKPMGSGQIQLEKKI